MSPEELAALAGAALSLFFAYFPWVKEKFDQLDSRWKPLVNAGVLLVVALLLVGLGCDPINLVDYFACSTAGLMDALTVWMWALVGNLLTYGIGVRQFKQFKAKPKKKK